MDDTELAEFYDFDLDVIRDLAASPEGPTVLVNLFEFREQAAYADDDRDSPCTGVEAMLRYADVSGSRLAAVGGRFLHQGLGAGALEGSPAHFVAIGEYPSAQAVLDLLHDPEYAAAYRHRRAAVARQTVQVSRPMA